MNRIYQITLVFLLMSSGLIGQKRGTTSINESTYNAMTWRNIGPFRGGRSAAVTGVAGKANLYYFGSTGGGVWRTTDAGNTYENISDGFFGGSVGAIAVSEWDPNVIYVGNGEKTVRGNVSSGDGIWKSVDAGKTWKSIGLKNSRHISRIRIHPKNPDIVFAAVMGDLYKSSEERGVYKSMDGGKTWKKVLFASDDAGAVDLVLDPNNARVLYASTWNIRRTPYSLESGGKDSKMWKSTDGGETWKDISSRPGLPSGLWGISGITVSPVNSDYVWAIIENANGGLFKSTDAGATWTKVNSERKLRQRAWYYSRIYADSQDLNRIYVLNVAYHQSNDGGKTFKTYRAPHGDHHDLWIAPEDNNRMMIADDGGAQISFDAGENWSTYMNQPTSQFYRVTTDNHFPYRIYGAQQDNSTVRIDHRSDGRYITESNWESTAGGESAHIAVDPLNNDIVYGGSYGGLLTRVNHETGSTRAINVWPDNPMGHGAEDFKYRFQWNFPIFFSPHNPKKLYTTSQHLHVTYNEGQSWEVISPDLTRNDPSTLKSSGGPITKDNTGVEYYATIFAAVESPLEEGLIWAGSDDGLIHVTKDGGKSWDNVTPKKMPEWMMINSIEVDPFEKGTAYVAGTKYKKGDYAPYLYKTTDYGQSWELITNGIPNEYFTRVVRADPGRKGLLYAGTERGIFISFDYGKSWNPFQLNLPIVPITDLTVKEDNLIAATQGRSFWLIDDLTPLYQVDDNTLESEMTLFKVKDTYRMSGGAARPSKTMGANKAAGVGVNFYLKSVEKTDTVSIAYKDKGGIAIQVYSTHPNKDKEEQKLKVNQGSNIVHWNMMYKGAERVPGMILWWSSLSGPKAVPGAYEVVLTKNGQSTSQPFTIKADPRSESSQEQMQAQFDFIISVRDQLTEVHKAIKNIRKVRKQTQRLEKELKGKEEYLDLYELASKMSKELTTIEETLYQTKSRSNQDPLNFPIRLNNKLAHLNALTSMGDFGPTDQAVELRKELGELIDTQLDLYNKALGDDLVQLNKLVKQSDIEFISIDE
ncbi:glycosyl hydrolase [Flavobacteriaceae bacterium]|nr:glycosyl hydrolase [Flavobacteriaceae bacterium]